MHRLVIILCALILLAAGEATADEFAVADSAADASPLSSIKILADSEEYDWATERFSAQGNVRVTYGETLLTADTVLGNPFTGEIQAAGHVTFENGTRTLTGESFTYNYKTSEGVAGNASAVVDNVYFRGEELKSAPDKYTLTGSRFTTCDEEHPHYYLSARYVIGRSDAKDDQHHNRQHYDPHADRIAFPQDYYAHNDRHNPENWTAEQSQHRKDEPKDHQGSRILRRSRGWRIWRRLTRWRRRPTRRLCLRMKRASTLPTSSARREVARPALRAGNPFSCSAHEIPPENVCLLFVQPGAMSFLTTR